MKITDFNKLGLKHKKMMQEQEKDREFEKRINKMIHQEKTVHTFLADDGLYKISFEKIS